MSTRNLNRLDTLRRFRELVEGVGGWSVSTATNASRWYWDTALQQIHRLGAWPLFRATVDVDERDPTRRYILKVSETLPRWMLRTQIFGSRLVTGF